MARARLLSPLVVLLALLLALVPCLAAAGTPTLLAGDGTTPLALTGLPPVLGDEVIREELHSGLTNTLLLLVKVDPDHGRKLRGAVAIDIRYELWDEVYLLTTTTLDGQGRQEQADSFEALLAWWQDLRLDILAPGTLAGQHGRAAEIELSLLPFSQAEQRDAQLWLTRSVTSDGPRSTADAVRAKGRVEGTNDRVLDILVATSIKRRSTYSFRWPATITQGRASEPEDDP